jgi:hypothetical protein
MKVGDKVKINEYELPDEIREDIDEKEYSKVHVIQKIIKDEDYPILLILLYKNKIQGLQFKEEELMEVKRKITL